MTNELRTSDQVRFETPLLAPGRYLVSSEGTGELRVRIGGVPALDVTDNGCSNMAVTNACTIVLARASVIYGLLHANRPGMVRLFATREGQSPPALAGAVANWSGLTAEGELGWGVSQGTPLLPPGDYEVEFEEPLSARNLTDLSVWAHLSGRRERAPAHLRCVKTAAASPRGVRTCRMHLVYADILSIGAFRVSDDYPFPRATYRLAVRPVPPPGPPERLHHLLGRAGETCQQACVREGSVEAGFGSVGLDCEAHVSVPACALETSWIYRLDGGWEACLDAWSADVPASSNTAPWNNQFCCQCLAPAPVEPEPEPEPQPEPEPEPVPAAQFVLGAQGGSCDAACADRGLACEGSGSVAADCGAHAELEECSDASSWIYRDHPTTGAFCTDAWGASDACTYNPNTANQFCCRCGA